MHARSAIARFAPIILLLVCVCVSSERGREGVRGRRGGGERSHLLVRASNNKVFVRSVGPFSREV